ncbi:hypothetical protein MBLNU13_g02976t1 [Cladosporium sp. NU13]
MAVATSTRATPKSSHVSDQLVQPFLQPDFDPATYLNSTLPSLSLSNARTTSGNAVALPELSVQTQALLSQLNAQTTRLSNSLTQLTDEIIRSGGRLAYEVEVLRSETTGLTDSLDNGLRKDIELLAPAKQVSEEAAPAEAAVSDTTTQEPEYLQNLRTLSTLRTHLDSVIQVFGAATAWPVAPSEVASGASSFISVSGPEATEENRNREMKAKEYTDGLRAEINTLLSSVDTAGLEAASERVEELRALAEVWKGTAEEKARTKIVESLVKTVEDKQKAMGRKADGRRQPERAVDMRYGDLDGRGAGAGEGGYGFLQNLRNLKDGMYLD